uniref:Uncharacterized protein n=1 Tax=Magallana gigas TaxID=29159 RepID=A0A8W8J5Z5_MAGGI
MYLKHIQQSIFLAAVLPETTHHVTTKHVTTTPRPTPERYEQTNNFYLYDRDSKLMFELYDAGYYVQLPLKELEYYSHRNYAMCTHTNGNPPNTTFFMVYPKPDK